MAKLVHPKGQLKKYYIFSPFLRIFHWIMVGCIFGLFITGLFIMDPISGGPGHEPTFADWRLSVDLLRNIHFLLGFVFTASFVFTYLWLDYKSWRPSLTKVLDYEIYGRNSRSSNALWFIKIFT